MQISESTTGNKYEVIGDSVVWSNDLYEKQATITIKDFKKLCRIFKIKINKDIKEIKEEI